jgi:Aspartyl protease
MADEKALLDSRATENFIDETTWQQLGIGRKELGKPITVTNVDGTENKKGKIMHYCWLRIQKGTHDKLQRFFITDLGQDQIILGYPFLYHFNPPVDWTAGRIRGAPIQLQSPHYKYVQRTILRMQMEAIQHHGRPKEGQALFVRRTNIAQQWAQEAEKGKVHLTLETIPEEYR